MNRDVPIGGVVGGRPPMFSHLQESWSKVSQAARGLATGSIAQKAPPTGVTAHHWLRIMITILFHKNNIDNNTPRGYSLLVHTGQCLRV